MSESEGYDDKDTIEGEESNRPWRVQLSVKVDGQHLLNLRAVTSAELDAQIKWAVKNAEQIQAACAALEGQKAPPAPAYTTAPARGYAPPQSAAVPSAGRTGPVGIVKMDMDMLKKDGTPMKSPKYSFKFSNGQRLSTFDGLVGDAGKLLYTEGAQVVYTTKVNGEYTNLASIGRA